MPHHRCVSRRSGRAVPSRFVRRGLALGVISSSHVSGHATSSADVIAGRHSLESSLDRLCGRSRVSALGVKPFDEPLGGVPTGASRAFNVDPRSPEPSGSLGGTCHEPAESKRPCREMSALLTEAPRARRVHADPGSLCPRSARPMGAETAQMLAIGSETAGNPRAAAR